MQIGFIGAGKMAEAMIAGLVRAGTSRPETIHASDISAARRELLAHTHGIHTTADNIAVAEATTVLFLAVKPQQLDALLTEIAPVLSVRHLVLSIAAGKQLAFLEQRLARARLVRVMPNLACLVGEAMSVFALGARTTADDRQQVLRLLGSFGRALELPENQFDAVTALSGSGPAFFAYLLAGLAEGAVAEGMSRETALTLGAQTMLGAARLLQDGRFQPAQLMDAVTSARGTTAAGRAVLEPSDVHQVLIQTVRAAARRSRELSG